METILILHKKIYDIDMVDSISFLLDFVHRYYALGIIIINFHQVPKFLFYYTIIGKKICHLNIPDIISTHCDLFNYFYKFIHGLVTIAINIRTY